MQLCLGLSVPSMNVSQCSCVGFLWHADAVFVFGFVLTLVCLLDSVCLYTMCLIIHPLLWSKKWSSILDLCVCLHSVWMLSALHVFKGFSFVCLLCYFALVHILFHHQSISGVSKLSKQKTRLLSYRLWADWTVVSGRKQCSVIGLMGGIFSWRNTAPCWYQWEG